MRSRQDIAEQVLSEMLGHSVALDEIYATCPGVKHHTTKNARKDFRVCLDGAPTGYCLHSHCADEVAAFNKEMRRRIWFAENKNSESAEAFRQAREWGVAAEPKAHGKKRPDIDKASIWEFTRDMPQVDFAWCRRRSPVGVESVEPADFLNHLYEEDERVLVFVNEYSQGDFIAWKRPAELDNPSTVQTFRLSQQRNVKAVPSALPRTGKNGVWFQVQPVTGNWEPKPKVSYPEGGGRQVEGQWTRRSECNMTAWRYFVLESDDIAPETWLRVVINLQLPIVALYTSGGRSIHALVKLPVASKGEWDVVRDHLYQLVCPLGADGGALTAVRLSRLPGPMREGKTDKHGVYHRYPTPQKQELIYLNPRADGRPIYMLPEVRA